MDVGICVDIAHWEPPDTVGKLYTSMLPVGVISLSDIRSSSFCSFEAGRVSRYR